MDEAADGPCAYAGNDIKVAHHNMAVTQGEFGALVEDLVATLDKFKVPAKEKGEVLGALGPLGPQIVESQSTATGTALPATFKPAPAMPATLHNMKKKRRCKPRRPPGFRRVGFCPRLRL